VRLRKSGFKFSIAVLLLATAAPPASAQDKTDPIQFSLVTDRASVQRGQIFHAQLNARIADGWHLYSMVPMPNGPIATRIELPAEQPFAVAGDVTAPNPLVAFDPNFEMNVEYFETDATFRIPVKADATAPLGSQRLLVDVIFQTCNDRICLPPKRISTAVALTIAAASMSGGSQSASHSLETVLKATSGSAKASNVLPSTDMSPAVPPITVAAAQRPSEGSVNSIRRWNASTSNRMVAGLASFLWFAMAMGALSLLTPCVFPMVPITLSYFSNHASSGRSSAIWMSVIYGIGIVLTFSALGLTLALVFGAGGVNQLAANPWVNVLITVIFVAFALSLFGAYFVQVPPGLMNRIDAFTRSHQASQAAGALLMGFTFTLTSFTCTAPFVGTLLVMAAGGNWHWPLAGMLAYSTVFALPFVLLAVAPQLVSQLPRAGGWMNSVKVVMGFLELAAAMKFLSNADLVWRWGIFTRTVVLAVWIAIGFAIVLYILGLYRFGHDAKIEHIGLGRLASAMVFLVLTVSLVPGLLGHPLGELDSFLPPGEERDATAMAASPGEVNWILNDYEGALARGRQSNKLVFIDFTGYTCTNCRWMEANIFPKPEVKSELLKFVTVRLYTDGDGEIYAKQQAFQQEEFGTVALPLYAIVRSDGTPVASFSGLTRDGGEFVRFLQSRDGS
jgi:thiol:disulfide interchange protein DsbD